LKHNMVVSASVSVAGLIFPLGLGAALGVGVYREFSSPTVNFGNFLLFVAVAVGITAFPVLCRILTTLELLHTEVGLITLSAGIGNDIIGWILLALTVALVNASSGLTALYVLLTCVGFTIFLLLPVRWGYRWLAIRTGSLEKGTPSPFMMTITLFIVLISAFFTDIIGIHAIFGGFLAGLVVPHDNGYAISITEKLEDLVTIIFLPLYFVITGLKTNLGLLNTGISWAYIVIVCLVAFTSKFFSCGVTAYLNGYKWRESAAIGSLMSCKGLIELIVLNIGLQAKVLDTLTFSMFVVVALVLTFTTSPLVLLFYPLSYRLKQKATIKPAGETGDTGVVTVKSLSNDGGNKRIFALILDKMESLPAALTLSQLLSSPFTSSPSSSRSTSIDEKAGLEVDIASEPITPPITIEALRLIELTNRTSAIFKSHEASSLIYNDAVINTFKTFGQLNRLHVAANLSVVTQEQFPDIVAKHVSDTGSQMTIIPWPRGVTSLVDEEQTGARNPFDGVFHKTTTVDQTSSVIYSEFIRNVFLRSPSDVALFVERGMPVNGGYGTSSSQHIFLPFFGGPDDRLALAFLGQLCENPSVTATVVRLVMKDGAGDAEDIKSELHPPNYNAVLYQNTVAAADTIYGQSTAQIRLESDTVDNLTWQQFIKPTTTNSRITFHTENTPSPLTRAIELSKAEAASRSSSSNKIMIVLAGRSRRMAVQYLDGEFRSLITDSGVSISSSVPKTLGDVGAAMVATNVNASLLILQAALAESCSDGSC